MNKQEQIEELRSLSEKALKTISHWSAISRGDIQLEIYHAIEDELKPVKKLLALLAQAADSVPAHVAVISPPEAQAILANPHATKEEIEQAHRMTYEIPCEHRAAAQPVESRLSEGLKNNRPWPGGGIESFSEGDEEPVSEFIQALEVLADKMGERCGDHCSNSCRMCEVRNDLRLILVRNAEHAASRPEKKDITIDELEKLYTSSKTYFDPGHNLFWQNFTKAINEYFRRK